MRGIEWWARHRTRSRPASLPTLRLRAPDAAQRVALREAVRCRGHKRVYARLRRAMVSVALDSKKPGSRFCEAARRALHRARDTLAVIPGRAPSARTRNPEVLRDAFTSRFRVRRHRAA